MLRTIYITYIVIDTIHWVIYIAAIHIYFLRIKQKIFFIHYVAINTIYQFNFDKLIISNNIYKPNLFLLNAFNIDTHKNDTIHMTLKLFIKCSILLFNNNEC